MTDKKEEILNKKFKDNIPAEFNGKIWDDKLLEAMTEYADLQSKERAIGFKNWCDDNKIKTVECFKKGEWSMLNRDQKGKDYTTSELYTEYEIFTKQK